MTTIGGPLDYRQLADLHRPTDHAALVQEVKRLARTGLTPRDIGAALSMDWAAVESILRCNQGLGADRERAA